MQEILLRTNWWPAASENLFFKMIFAVQSFLQHLLFIVRKKMRIIIDFSFTEISFLLMISFSCLLMSSFAINSICYWPWLLAIEYEANKISIDFGLKKSLIKYNNGRFMIFDQVFAITVKYARTFWSCFVHNYD